MAIKNTTDQLVKVTDGKWSSANWYSVLAARARDLASDKDHYFSYQDRNALNKNVTRWQIVTIYEMAYSELTESFHGHLERIEELESEKRVLLNSNHHLEEYAGKLRERLEIAQRRVNGLLTVIEKEIPPEIYP